VSLPQARWPKRQTTGLASSARRADPALSRRLRGGWPEGSCRPSRFRGPMAWP